MKKISTLALIFLWMSQSAFAACEHERSQRNRYQILCDATSGTSAVVAAAGNAIFPFFGGLLGLIPGAAAFAACRERDIWQERLLSCEQGTLLQAAQGAELSQRQARMVQEINDRYDALNAAQVPAFVDGMEEFILALISGGFDINDPSVLAEIEGQYQVRRSEIDEAIRIHEENRELELRSVQ